MLTLFGKGQQTNLRSTPLVLYSRTRRMMFGADICRWHKIVDPWFISKTEKEVQVPAAAIEVLLIVPACATAFMILCF